MQINSGQFSAPQTHSQFKAREAAVRLLENNDLSRGVADAQKDLCNIGLSAQNQDELELAKASAAMMETLHRPLQNAPDQVKDAEAYEVWSKEQEWANKVSRPALQVALNSLAAGLPPGGASSAIFEVAKAMVDAASDQLQSGKSTNLPVQNALKAGPGKYSLATDDNHAYFGQELLKSASPMPVALTVEMARGVYEHALYNEPMKPLPQLISQVALDQLSQHTDAEVFLSKSYRYMNVLDKVAEEKPPVGQGEPRMTLQEQLAYLARHAQG